MVAGVGLSSEKRRTRPADTSPGLQATGAAALVLLLLLPVVAAGERKRRASGGGAMVKGPKTATGAGSVGAAAQPEK